MLAKGGMLKGLLPVTERESRAFVEAAGALVVVPLPEAEALVTAEVAVVEPEVVVATEDGDDDDDAAA